MSSESVKPTPADARPAAEPSLVTARRILARLDALVNEQPFADLESAVCERLICEELAAEPESEVLIEPELPGYLPFQKKLIAAEQRIRELEQEKYRVTCERANAEVAAAKATGRAEQAEARLAAIIKGLEDCRCISSLEITDRIQLFVRGEDRKIYIDEAEVRALLARALGGAAFVAPARCDNTRAALSDGRRASQGACMMVRAKFVLSEITEFSYGGKKLKFTAQYDQTIPEDQRFQKATPTGEFTMICDNPAANAQLHIGKAYYFDISEAV